MSMVYTAHEQTSATRNVSGRSRMAKGAGGGSSGNSASGTRQARRGSSTLQADPDDARQTSFAVISPMGCTLREQRRRTNSATITRLRDTITDHIEKGESAISLRGTLHREISRDGVRILGVDSSEHPDNDLWKSFQEWGLRNGLSIILQQKDRNLTGMGMVVAVPSYEALRPAV